MLIDKVRELPPDQRIIIAYDGMSLDQATAMHASFNEAGFHPIAKANSMAIRPGLDAVMQKFTAMNASVMYDPKLHDTNETMFNSVSAVAAADPTSPMMLTLHAPNGMDA